MSAVLVKMLATFFYSGYFPLIPGTFASAVGVFCFYFIKDNPFIYTLALFIVTITGFLVAGRAEAIFKKKDDRRIVIDEIAGMLLALMFLPCDIKIVVMGFSLFRLLDALKPYPLNQLQDWKGSFGVMSDDIAAGIYTNIILQAGVRLASFITS